MNSNKTWILAAALMLSGAMTVRAEDTNEIKTGVVEAAVGSMTATVLKVDYEHRLITLKTKEGVEQTIQAGPEVTRLKEIKKGDEVTVDYLESVAVAVMSPDENVATAQGSQTTLVRNKTKKPSATMVETNVVTATVKKIDAKKRKATLVGPEGDSFDIDVAPDVKNLDKVKKGDQVIIKRTRTVAIAVNKPSK